MDAAAPVLTPAEAMMLMDLRGASPAGLFKVSAMGLLLRRVLRAEAEVEHGWIRTRTVTLLRPGQVPALPPHEWAVVWLVQAVMRWQPHGALVESVVDAARREYGSALNRYRRDLVLPALLDRRLVRMQLSKWLKIERPAPTPAGTAALARLDAMLDQGRRVPGWLDTDPRQAALAVAALGPLILLVDELRPHLTRLAAAMQRRDEGADSGSSGSDGPGTGHCPPGDQSPRVEDADGFDFGALDSAAFDAGPFDALDSAMSSFDAATDGGDGGDGGGDSGGGGGGE